MNQITTWGIVNNSKGIFIENWNVDDILRYKDSDINVQNYRNGRIGMYEGNDKILCNGFILNDNEYINSHRTWKSNSNNNVCGIEFRTNIYRVFSCVSDVNCVNNTGWITYNDYYLSGFYGYHDDTINKIGYNINPLPYVTQTYCDLDTNTDDSEIVCLQPIHLAKEMLLRLIKIKETFDITFSMKLYSYPATHEYVILNCGSISNEISSRFPLVSIIGNPSLGGLTLTVSVSQESLIQDSNCSAYFPSLSLNKEYNITISGNSDTFRIEINNNVTICSKASHAFKSNSYETCYLTPENTDYASPSILISNFNILFKDGM